MQGLLHDLAKGTPSFPGDLAQLRDGRPGFTVYAAGGQGRESSAGLKLFEFLGADQAVRAIVQARAALAGLDASGFSAHSLRSGFVTEAAAQNIPMPETMALTGHRSPASVIGYFRQGEVLGLRAARLMEDNNAEPPEPKKQR